MFRSSFGQLLTLLALLNSISSFHHNGFDSKALRSIRLNAASTVGRAGWADDESLAGQRDISSRRKLNATFVENLVIKSSNFNGSFTPIKHFLSLYIVSNLITLYLIILLGLCHRIFDNFMCFKHGFLLHVRIP